jgi:hypothetical protein
MRTLILGSLALVLGACAANHAVMRGSVVMKINDTDAHVCLGVGEVKVNDTVRLYRNVCDTGSKQPVCHRQDVADGRVRELLDSHYSVVVFPAGTPFQEGDTVEKAR